MTDRQMRQILDAARRRELVDVTVSLVAAFMRKGLNFDESLAMAAHGARKLIATLDAAEPDE